MNELIKRKFVLFEHAVELKQLGYDEPSIAHWYNGFGKPEIYIGEQFSISQKATHSSWDILCLAPLWQEAFDWILNRLTDEYYIEQYNDEIRVNYQGADMEVHILFKGNKIGALNLLIGIYKVNNNL